MNGIRFSVCEIRPALMPMRIYSSDQTIGNAADGGVRNGFDILSKASKSLLMKNAEIPPAARAIII